MPKAHVYICEKYPIYYLNTPGFDDTPYGVEVELTDEELAEIRNSEIRYKEAQLILSRKLREKQRPIGI